MNTTLTYERTNNFSTTKTMTALCALVLSDRGELDVNAPVQKYWPEFAQNGKDGVLVRHFLGHSSGLPGWTERVTVEDIEDREKATTLLVTDRVFFNPYITPIVQGYAPLLDGRRIAFSGGAGGSIIVNDFDARMTVAYVMNTHREHGGVDPRGLEIVRAADESITHQRPACIVSTNCSRC